MLYCREQNLRHLYNLTIEEYDKLKEKQDHSCAICDVEQDPLYIDHCHETGKVRGLLCIQCNTALGMFKDSTYILNSAIDYLYESRKDDPY